VKIVSGSASQYAAADACSKSMCLIRPEPIRTLFQELDHFESLAADPGAAEIPVTIGGDYAIARGLGLCIR
jgi:hypothetical protein